jgi:anaerobic selenocysteine-containing dehydrogenase
VGRTAAFATRAVLVAPGTEAALLLGVARRLGAVVPEVDGAADVPGADVLAAALQKAKAPALVLCAQDGATANAHVAALAAARIAAKLNAPLLPLLTYGNALGARQAATRHGAVPLADAVAQIAAGRIRNLVLLGVDILAALPHLGEQMLRRVEFVAVAAPFANATTARAHVVLPLGLGCEEAGEVMLPSGETVTACPPAPPVAGALTLTELVETMRAQLGGARSDRPAATPAQTSWQLAPPRTGDGLTLIGCGDVLGFDDGSLSSHSDWVQAVRPEPSLLVHPADGKRTGLRTGSTARVKTPAGEARLAVEWTTDVPPGVAAVPLCFPQTRALFRWEIDSAASLVRCGPVEVTLGPAS